jgi:hypothetical protein
MSFLLIGVLISPPNLFGQGKRTIPKGFELYTPTKIEWAVLELQAANGQTVMTAESPVMVSFMEIGDGMTVLCLIQYTNDFPAAALKLNRESIQYAFDKYVQGRHWQWLKLSFEERSLGSSWPQK